MRTKKNRRSLIRRLSNGAINQWRDRLRACVRVDGGTLST